MKPATRKHTTNELIRASEYLDAVDLDNGKSAYFASETQRWYVVAHAELATLVEYIDHDDPQISNDAYSHWCASHTDVEEMPAGWTPDADSAHGLTFAEWLAAAGRTDSASDYDLRAAWRAGEDPTEYASESEVSS